MHHPPALRARFAPLLLIVFGFPFLANAQIGVTLQSTPACNMDGTLTATVTGAMPPYVYEWYHGYLAILTTTSTPTLTGLTPDSYSVKVTDVNGQIGHAQWYVSPVFSYWINSVSPVCPATTGTLSVVNPSNANPKSYQWLQNGTPVGTNSDVVSGMPIATDYDVIVTDLTTGCVTQFSQMAHDTLMTIYAISPIQATITPINVSCTSFNADIAVVPGSGPYTFLWSNGQTTQTATGLPTYTQNVTCTVTDANGCTGTFYTSSYPSVFSANASQTPATCQNLNGSASLIPNGGAAPYQYLWSTGAATSTLSGVGPGHYTYTITDNNGCQENSSVYIGHFSPIIITPALTASSSCIAPDGAVTLSISGGASPYTISWGGTIGTATRTGLAPGFYSFTVTDLNGCSNSGVVQIPYSTPIVVAISTTPSLCGAPTGTATVSVSGGASPYLYQWSNGSTATATSGLALGGVSCMITDNQGCKQGASQLVNNNTPIVLTVSPVNASCLYTADGSATVTASGGTPPYQYTWYNAPATGNSPTATGLLTGLYYVNVTDANSCQQYTHIGVGYNNNLTSCTSEINGTVYDDQNGNCIQDAGEAGLKDVLISCSPLGGYQYTDAFGNYSFRVPAGTYVLAHHPKRYHAPQCPTLGSATVAVASIGMVITQDFADLITPAADLRVRAYSLNPPRPGFSYTEKLVMENIGNQPMAAPSVQHHMDGQIAYTGTTGTATPMGTDWLSFDASGVSLPGSMDVVDNVYVLPTTIPLGTVINHVDSILPLAGDATQPDNIFYHQPIVIGSYDPNMIEVRPRGTDEAGIITRKDSTLEYVIHFQNTGTASAINVVLKDTLDPGLDIGSLDMGFATHAYTAQVSADRVLTVSFANIQLPDSFSDVEGSKGFVAFTIRPFTGQPDGTQFRSTADIYFDFNLPVRTNTALNTLEKVISVEKDVQQPVLQLIPNPGTGKVLLSSAGLLQSQSVDVQVMDIAGHVLMPGFAAARASAGAGWEADLSHLPGGIYLLVVTQGEKRLQAKYVLTH